MDSDFPVKHVQFIAPVDWGHAGATTTLPAGWTAALVQVEGLGMIRAVNGTTVRHVPLTNVAAFDLESLAGPKVLASSVPSAKRRRPT